MCQFSRRHAILITALVLTALVFSCYGTGIGTSIIQSNVQEHGQVLMICCSEEKDSSLFMNHVSMAFVLPAAGVFVAALIALAFIFTQTGLRFSLASTRFHLYARAVRMRHGSSQQFCPLVTQFRGGLLNPKTF